MADVKKSARKKKRKDEKEEDTMDKDETAVAKYLRWNLPSKKSTFYGDQVEYFTGAKAVDFLLESKWANGKASKSKVQFTDRESVVVFLDRLLCLGIFRHVEKIKKDVKKVEKKGKEGSPKEVRKRKPEKAAVKDPKEKDESKDGKKKRKVKYMLEAHPEHFFSDDDEAFMWIFDPVHPRSFLMGILLVLAVIACCLFPLWPDSVRVYSWYVSVAIAGCIGALFAVALFRYVVFAAAWVLTFGKLSFWFLPNLTAECGFLDSFKPSYEYEYRSGESVTVGEESNSGNKDNEEKETTAPLLEETANGTQNGDDNNSSSGKESRDTDAENDSSWVKVKKTDAQTSPTTEDC